MNDTKSLFESKTFWFSMLPVVAGIAGMFHYHLSADDWQGIVNAGFTLAAAGGGVLAIIMRVKATHTITSVLPKPAASK